MYFVRHKFWRCDIEAVSLEKNEREEEKKIIHDQTNLYTCIYAILSSGAILIGIFQDATEVCN